MQIRHGGNIFQIAAQRGWDWRQVADFSASINPLGPSAEVWRALERAKDRLVHYPEAYAETLTQALAAHWGVEASCVLAGNGATDLIHFFARIFEVRRVYLAAPVFSEFHRAYPQAVLVPFEADAWPRDGLLIVTRPANPTGAMPELDHYLKQAANPVLVDESFIEFTGYSSLAGLAAQRDNFFVLRSLTKFYALPGLRVGALVGPAKVLDGWRARREPWQVNVLAAEAAQAAIADRDHAHQTLQFVASERAWLTEQLAQLPGIEPQRSHANYFLVRMDRPVGPLVEGLLQEKILVRDCSGWPGVAFPHALRLAIRPRQENERLLEAWRRHWR
ncbi:MAG: aminotransferase class I/II-fold pyridoxal phosphate-dependent enzyme [Bryobacteraceae bacterium]|nr:aminotransferase class I/II-fold pyridoxal phosphate-dependent enzyme [Bryobacteraceae bacterium]MDW8376626.1 aminotransferase class I/II-fold pyridoxal phosphate-dependent enzyme [Bryobacterales bacterium]